MKMVTCFPQLAWGAASPEPQTDRFPLSFLSSKQNQTSTQIGAPSSKVLESYNLTGEEAGTSRGSGSCPALSVWDGESPHHSVGCSGAVQGWGQA